MTTDCQHCILTYGSRKGKETREDTEVDVKLDWKRNFESRDGGVTQNPRVTKLRGRKKK